MSLPRHLADDIKTAMTGADWHDDALCNRSTVDPDWWFDLERAPGNRVSRNAALALTLCRACPVQAPCLAAALERDERYGIWGATTPAQRQALTRHNRTKGDTA